MPRVRAGWKGKYSLEKHQFYTAYHYALQFNDWLAKYNAYSNEVEGVRYDKDKVQASASTSSSTELLSIKRVELKQKMDSIVDTAKEADPYIWRWILKAATAEGVTYESLANPTNSDDDPIPCGREMYYDRRRRFYWLLAQRML